MLDDFSRPLMDEVTEKIDDYVHELCIEKRFKPARYFCENRYERIALKGFLKKVITVLMEKESDTDPEGAFDDLYEAVRDKLSENTAVKVKQTDDGTVSIDIGERIKLNLRKKEENCELSISAPYIEEMPEEDMKDPEMPNGEEEEKPLIIPGDRLTAFLNTMGYISENSHSFKDWVRLSGKDLWERYKYRYFPKKDVLDKMPVYWWSEWMEHASDEDLSDHAMLKKMIARRGECFIYAPEALKKDRRTALSAIKDFSYTITHASQELQNDRGFVLQAIEANPGAFQYVTDKFKDDKKVALKAIQGGGYNIQYVSDRLKNDREIVEAAMVRGIMNFQYASDEIRNDKEYVMAAVSERGELLKAISESLRSDRDVVLSAVKTNGDALQYALGDLNDDLEIVSAAVENRGSALAYASERLRGNKDIVLKASENDGHSLEYASEDLRDDEEFMLKAIGNKGEAYYYVSERLAKDTDVIKAAVKSGGHEILENVPEEIKAKPDVAICLLETLLEQIPDFDDYGEFYDGTSEYYGVFEKFEDVFFETVECIPVKKLKNGRELTGKICELAVKADEAYYDDGNNPYESSHERLPDKLKEYFENNKIAYSESIDRAIERRIAKEYHRKEYGDDIPLEERCFLYARDYYEWFAWRKILLIEGIDEYRRYVGGGWVYSVMTEYVKYLCANWPGIFHDSKQWRDEEYEVDLDKAYEELNERLSSRMKVERNASEYYYSENVTVYINDKVRLELVRNMPLKTLYIWVNDYDSDLESGYFLAPDRLDKFSEMCIFILENYETYEKKAEERAKELLKEHEGDDDVQ